MDLVGEELRPAGWNDRRAMPMRRNFAGRLMFLEQHPLLGGWKLVDSIVYLWDTQRVAVLMSVVDEGGILLG